MKLTQSRYSRRETRRLDRKDVIMSDNVMTRSRHSTERSGWRKRFVAGVKRSWPWYILMLPAIVAFAIFCYWPMYGILMAFVDYSPTKGILGSEWVGMEHFKRFLNYPDFWVMIKNTLRITLYSLATFPCSIIFALILNEISNLKFKKTVQMVTYAPHFLSEVVLCSLVLLFLDRSVGPVNNVIEALGGTRVDFISNPDYFASIYVWSGVWQGLGWGSILYISALSSISPELVEAAKIDGAGRFRIIWNVNIPGILPTIIITFIMSTGGLLSVGYSKIYLLQNDLNRSASNVLATYTYEIGLLGGQYSYSTAIGLFNTLCNIAILLIVNAVVKKVSDVGIF